MARKYHQGRFKPKNPEKYKGNVSNIVFRSGYEYKCMKFLDENTNIIEWQSEEISIPYISPLDNRLHRYFPDFVAVVRQKDGSIKTIMIEVKPHKETQEPKSKRKTRQFLNEVATWGINQSKWKSAREYCADRNWEFTLITEMQLFNSKNK